MEYKTLKDIAKITMGQSPDSSSYNNEKDGLPFFQGNADFGELYPNERFWCNAPKKVAMPGDILISVRAPIGALNYAKGKSCIGRGLAAITIENIVERNYIFHLLKARNNYLNSMGTGSTFKAIGKNVLEEILIPQISREEQQKCVNMMDLLGSIIRERQSQLGKFDEIIKARFVEMFGDPVSNPYELPVVKLAELSELITKGASPSWQGFSYTDDSSQTLFVTSENVRGGFLDLSSPKYIEDGFNDKQKRSMIHKGDFLINIVGASIGRAAQFNLECKANMNQASALVRINDNRIIDKYLLVYLNSDKAQRMYDSMKSDTGRANLSIQDINDLTIMLPPLDKQIEYETFVQQVNKSKVVSQHTTSNPYIQNLNFAVKWL
jgi:restriction endonuclease, S subunit